MIARSKADGLDAARQWAVDFGRVALAHLRKRPEMRDDREFPWHWYQGFDPVAPGAVLRRIARQVRDRIAPARSFGALELDWVTANAAQLHRIRSALADESSRRDFDRYWMLRIAGPWRYGFAPDTEGFVRVIADEPFTDPTLAADYQGLPLRWITFAVGDSASEVRVITTRLQADLFERYGQYFPSGAAAVCRPTPGDVVIDCGACVGDATLTFAAAVGEHGRVFGFDPLAHHLRYGALQLAANPSLRHRVEFIEAAVGDKSRDAQASVEQPTAILSGFHDIAAFRSLSLDDFVETRALERIDVIKIDIEGAEPAAIRGAARTIALHRPRLAISIYHRQNDLCDVFDLISAIEPAYRFAFAHHSPVRWEAVLYGWVPEPPPGIPAMASSDHD